MEVRHINNQSDGYFQAFDQDTEAGKMAYRNSGAGEITIDHTEVNEAFSGRGVGKKLLMATVEYAREKNFKIKPVCSFAKSMFDKLEAIRDVLV